MKYKMMKVFDCQDMPIEMKKSFLIQATEDGACGNSCAADWWVEKRDGQFDEVSQWLINNGAEENEHVLVKCWW